MEERSFIIVSIPPPLSLIEVLDGFCQSPAHPLSPSAVSGVRKPLPVK